MTHYYHLHKRYGPNTGNDAGVRILFHLTQDVHREMNDAKVSIKISRYMSVFIRLLRGFLINWFGN